MRQTGQDKVMVDKNLAANLRVLLDARKLSPYDLADELNKRGLSISPQSVYKWLEGGWIRQETAQAVADFLHVGVAELLYGHLQETHTTGETHVGNVKRTGGGTRVALIAWRDIRGAQVQHSIDDSIVVSWLPKPVNCGPRTFVLQVQGISNEGEIHDGDYIYVDPDIQPKHEDFVLVDMPHWPEPRLLYLTVEGSRPFLVSYNPAYRERPIELSPAMLLGVVVFSGKLRRK